MNYSDLIGCNFKVHGRSKEEGFDCYGIAIEVLRRNNKHLVDVFYDSLDTSIEINNVIKFTNNLQKIDKLENLCIIEINVKGLPIHIGIYIGKGQMIHSTKNYGVVIEPVQRYKKRIVGYYKVTDN